LLNKDYKILARILANHLRLILEDQLQSTQFCCVLGNSILEAVSIIRETIIHAEITEITLCVLTLDFQNAFERISTASVQINGTIAGPIPIGSVVRQECPLSMLLYALCFHHLLCMLENNLPGITIGQRTRRSTVVAYADVVTVFVTRPMDFDTILRAIQLCKKATGTLLNPKKSKLLPSENGRHRQLS